MMPNKLKQVTLIGTGLVGSLLSVILARRGYRIKAYEKRPDLRRVVIPAGRSINLALAERGIHALRLAKVIDQVRPLLIPMRGRMLHDLDGRTEFVPYGQRPHEVIYSVSRQHLNRVLLDAAEATGQVDIRFETACENIDFSKGAITLLDEKRGDRSEDPFDLVMGADGAGSIVRESIVQATNGECSMDPLDHSYKELSIPQDSNGGFQMDRESLHIWPRGGFMLIALPNLDASFTVTLFLPTEGEPGFSQLRDSNAVDHFFRTNFPDAHKLMPNLVSDFFTNPTGALGTVRCWPWSFRNQALIMGDAAHAIVPFHGQGMNSGFEDCGELQRLLDESEDDWSRVCRSFPEQRKAHADAIADMALENYLDMRDYVRHEDFLLRKEIGFALERRVPEHFVPRYSMVMFHRVPYAEARRRGRIQEALLDKILTKADSIETVDMDEAECLVRAALQPIPNLADSFTPPPGLQ
jgi:kynurenine 3-monooxygenase